MESVQSVFFSLCFGLAPPGSDPPGPCAIRRLGYPHFGGAYTPSQGPQAGLPPYLPPPGPYPGPPSPRYPWTPSLRHPQTSPLPHTHTPPLYPIPSDLTPIPPIHCTPIPWPPPIPGSRTPPTLASGSRKVPRPDPAGGLARSLVYLETKLENK